MSDNIDDVREWFSEFDKSASIKKRVSGFKRMPTRKYCITKGGKFELGMTVDIIQQIKKKCPVYRIIFTDEFKAAFVCSYEFADRPLADIIKPEKYQERYYQEASIKKALKLGHGIFLLLTAAGKTYIEGLLIATINKYRKKNKTLIVVPTIQLVEQTYKDMLSFGFSENDMSKWSGGNKVDTSASIIIASASILLSKSQNLDVLEEIDLLLYDECHGLKRGNQINNIIKDIPTRNRFGFTGTMPETLIDQWSVIGKIGPILYEVPREEMVESGFIADTQIKVVSLNYNGGPVYPPYEFNYELDDKGNFVLDEHGNKKRLGPPTNPLVKYYAETEYTEQNPFRNSIIQSICKKLNKNVLIVVEHITHGETLVKELSGIKGKKVYFIQGDVDIEDREKYKEIMEKDDNVICIAISKIFSTGINIKNLHYIIFASAGKAKVKIIQSIGRGVRLHENKNKLYIFDLADNLKYGTDHLTRRKEIYEEEGFDIKVTQIFEKSDESLF